MKRYKPLLKEGNRVVEFRTDDGHKFNVNITVLKNGDVGLAFTIDDTKTIKLNEEECSELLMKLQKVVKTLK